MYYKVGQVLMQSAATISGRNCKVGQLLLQTRLFITKYGNYHKLGNYTLFRSDNSILIPKDKF